jgi:uncharacterized protein YyaL (SSP411 family)
MLYDNALLVPAYLEAYQATGEAFYRRVAEETLAYVRREMTNPEGPFYSTQDADSEGEEGKFYVWTAAEIESVLGPELAGTLNAVYGVRPAGNWQDPHDPHPDVGKNILHRVRTDEQAASFLNLPVEEVRRRLAEARRLLFEARSRRVWPGRDEKTLTAWNGLMISAFAQAAQVLDDPGYAETAARAADFILRRMRTTDGRLLRTYSTGSEPKLNAYLEDYSFLIDSLVTLYEATFEARCLREALALTEVMIDQFWDGAEGGFWFTGRDHEQLIARTKDPNDNATPSGNSVAVLALLRLAKLTGRADLMEKATATLRLFHDLLANRPFVAGQMLIALDFYLGPVREFVVVGDRDSTETKEVLRAIRSRFLPDRVLAFRPATGADAELEQLIPLLAGKTAAGAVTTYICENFACQAPLVGTGPLQAALSAEPK